MIRPLKSGTLGLEIASWLWGSVYSQVVQCYWHMKITNVRIINDYGIIFVFRGHNAAVLCVQFDDRKIVSGSYDKTIKVSNKLLKLVENSFVHQ